MSPILQSLANGSARGYGGYLPLGVSTAFESIATATGTGSSGTITFSSIPSTYRHLQIRALMRNDTAATTASSLRVRFNADTLSNYAHHTLSGDGSAAAASGTTPQGYINVANCNPGNSATSGIMGVSIIDILDYATSSKNRVLRALSGSDSNATDTTYKIVLSSGLWVNTNAITQIDLISATGNWTTSTTFALYGIKGA